MTATGTKKRRKGTVKNKLLVGGGTHRWLCFLVSNLICLGGGLFYVYGLYAPAIKAQLQFNQRAMNLFGAFAYSGSGIVGFPMTQFFQRFGPRASMFLLGVLLTCSMGGIYFCLIHQVSSVPLMGVLFFVLGGAMGALWLVTIFANQHNLVGAAVRRLRQQGETRGRGRRDEEEEEEGEEEQEVAKTKLYWEVLISAFLTATWGLGGTTFTLVYRFEFETSPISDFMLFQAVALAITCFLGVLFVGFDNSSSSSSSTLNDETDTAEVQSLLRRDQVEEEAEAEEELLASDSINSNYRQPQLRKEANEIEPQREEEKRREDRTTGEIFKGILTSFQFWGPFLFIFLGTGVGGTYIGNVGIIVNSLVAGVSDSGSESESEPGGETQSRIETQIIIFSIFQTVSRLVVLGLVSNPKIGRNLKTIPLIMTSLPLFMAGATLYSYFHQSLSALPYVTAVIAIGYGAIWSLFVTLLKFVPVNYNSEWETAISVGLLMSAPALSGLLFGQIVGALYDQHTTTDSLNCAGVQCYQGSYLLFSISAIISVFVCLLLRFKIASTITTSSP